MSAFKHNFTSCLAKRRLRKANTRSGTKVTCTSSSKLAYRFQIVLEGSYEPHESGYEG